MFGLPTLDIILGLVFLYLQLSLVCTAINEVIAHWLNRRPRTLIKGIGTLLSGEWKTSAKTFGSEKRHLPMSSKDTATPPASGSQPTINQIVKQLVRHPLIEGLSQSRRNLVGWTSGKPMPSYIPPGTFVDALLDIIRPSDGTSLSIDDIRSAVNALPDNQLKKPLQIFLAEAGGDVDEFKKRVEQWYGDAMERVSGLYKRNTQAITLIVATILTFAVKADTLEIVDALSSNATLRQAVVAQAEALANNPSADIRELIRLENLRRHAADSAGKADTSTKAPQTLRQAGIDSLMALREDSIVGFRYRQIEATIDSLKGIGLPLGWNMPDSIRTRIEKASLFGKVEEVIGFYLPRVVRHLLGLLITIFAISLGAPFWFDMLNKVINIRAAGRAPEEKPKSPEAAPPARGR
jgi:hypothetical protein